MNYVSIFSMTAAALLSSGAFAQTPVNPIDVNQINQTADAQAASVKVENTRSGKNFMARVGKHIADGLNPNFSITIPKDRILGEEDEAKIALVRCAERMLKKNSGGASAPSIAFDVLMAAMDQNGWSAEAAQIDTAVVQCKKLSNEINTYSNSKVDQKLRKESLEKITVTNAASNKVKSLIQALENPEILQCQVSTYAVTAGAILMAKVGLSSAKCLWSNGKVYKFYGPTLGFALGVGADFVSERYIQDDVSVGEGTPLHVFSNEQESYMSEGGPGSPMKGYLVTGIGSVYGSEPSAIADPDQGLAIGLSRRGGSISTGTFGFRLFNGKRHWGKLIDQLN